MVLPHKSVLSYLFNFKISGQSKTKSTFDWFDFEKGKAVVQDTVCSPKFAHH